MKKFFKFTPMLGSLIITIAIFLILFLLFKINAFGTISNIFRHKITTFDFSQTKTFSNDYLGISLNYPNSINYEESGVGGLSYNEDYGIISSAGNIMFYEKNRLDQHDFEKDVLQIKLYFGEFNKNNVEEFFWGNFTELSLLRKAYAMPPPTRKKINNLKIINIANNNYYKYSYILDQKKYDKYIYERDNEYIIFHFLNQNEDFIKNILSSVKTFEPRR